jgi:RNA polymerase sigma-70 factor (ECF subfamily)
MELVGRGDAAAFAVLVNRHTDRLYQVACRLLTDSAEAEDVVQECFARMWQHSPGWQPAGAGLIGWLYRITVNLCWDRRRGGMRIVTPGTLPERSDDALLADGLIEAEQANRALLAALEDLPERYRAALVLCYYSGLTNSAAADILQLNLKAMESLLGRARRQLRQLLESRSYSCGELLNVWQGRAA